MSSWGERGSVFQESPQASELLLRLAEYLYHVELPNFDIRGAAVIPQSLCERSLPIGPIQILTVGFRPDVFLAQQHKFCQKYEEAFYWVEQQLVFALKICIDCLHVGQMLFAGNKYLLLKRITVLFRYKKACGKPYRPID